MKSKPKGLNQFTTTAAEYNLYFLKQFIVLLLFNLEIQVEYSREVPNIPVS